MFDISLQKHPAYKELKEHIHILETANKYYPTIEVFGVIPSLYEALTQSLSHELNKSLITVTRDSQEIRKYLDSSIVVEFKSTTPSQVIKSIIEYGYKNTNKVQAIGEYSVKGDILTFWTPGLQHPIRLSFLGDEIESAFLYDEIYGKSLSVSNFFLLGDLEKIEESIYLDQIYIQSPSLNPAKVIIVFGGDSFDTYSSRSSISFDFSYSQLYFSRLDLLERDLKKKLTAGYNVKVYTSHEQDIPTSLKKFIIQSGYKGSGYESPALKLIVLTDKELFGTVFLGQEVRRLSSEKARKILSNLEGEIEIGDYIVHENHGIGLYKGIKQEEYTSEVRINVGESILRKIKEDYIVVGYAEGDELFVPLRQVDRLTKYISIDDQEPEITRLGKTDWEGIRSRARESIFEMAKDLVDLYAKRELAKAAKISTEATSEYEEFTDNFPFQETADQIQTEIDVLKDISSDKPMNRIIVGDVGFGKTEIAMRAAFKVVESGHQVAVLCPTTVLTSQHEKVFNDRFAGTEYRIGSLSRLNLSEQKGVLDKIKSGSIDIVIGTHRLISNDIAFKNLGLIVIDEEQKFGVKQKEKLKKLQVGVHVLSMSATPIPRSLSMALSSIHDISIIQTPPEGRRAIKNIVVKNDLNLIRNAIDFELKRHGQIYYVHNRVETLASTVAKISKLVPHAKIISAHGQMSPNLLTKNIEDFYAGRYDILACTTIIENGIDMPNVNTIIIEHAQNFGLGQMYQLRGRVGRGNKQAFAYFFYDGEEVEIDETIKESTIKDVSILKKLRESRKYKKRLQAIKDSNELGSGFKLASRDLEIRGAGNLLGKQQHGNIKQIGYALYMQMLAEEIEKLKNSDNKL